MSRGRATSLRNPDCLLPWFALRHRTTFASKGLPAEYLAAVLGFNRLGAVQIVAHRRMS